MKTNDNSGWRDVIAGAAFGALVIIVAAFLCELLTGCCPRATPVASRFDSVRVVRETSYIERLRIDTASVSLPSESHGAVTPLPPPPSIPNATPYSDTSRLSTSLAASEAWVIGRQLFHTLRNLQGQFRVPVMAKDTETRESRDSVRVVIEDRIVEIEKPPTWWARFWTASGKVAWGAALAALALGVATVVRKARGKF